MNLTIGLLQMEGHGFDQESNRLKGTAFCRQAAAQGADIALFPEMWNIGYAFYDPALPETLEQWQTQAIALDIGLGVRPDLTGQGRGATFANEVIEFGKRTYAPARLRVTIAAFNHRAQRVWDKMGFKRVQTFTRPGAQFDFVILEREA